MGMLRLGQEALDCNSPVTYGLRILRQRYHHRK